MTTVTTTKLPKIDGTELYYVTVRNESKVTNINVGKKTFQKVSEVLNHKEDTKKEVKLK